MKIIANHLFKVVKYNGPSSYDTIIHVVETENGFFEQDSRGNYFEFPYDRAKKLIISDLELLESSNNVKCMGVTGATSGDQ